MLTNQKKKIGETKSRAPEKKQQQRETRAEYNSAERSLSTDDHLTDGSEVILPFVSFQLSFRHLLKLAEATLSK